MSMDDHKPDLTEPNAGQSSELANRDYRQGSQRQNQGGQSAETDQPYGQDNGTVSKNELGTETENLVADDEIDPADGAAPINGIQGGDDYTDGAMPGLNPDMGGAEGAVDDRLVDEPDTSVRSDDDLRRQEGAEIEDLTAEDMSPATEI